MLAKGGSSGALLVKNRKNLSAKSPEATKDALEEIQKSSFEDFIVNRQRKQNIMKSQEKLHPTAVCLL
ncbi:hypothetical protein HMSSN139_48690 [Paenibacillus sp. HMSSN-139]|nr:hypothetical protein HMSSN139_48690 [Paenibacillus sp. HMSSN-139]